MLMEMFEMFRKSLQLDMKKENHNIKSNGRDSRKNLGLMLPKLIVRTWWKTSLVHFRAKNKLLELF